jgi:hypothetical protein
MQIIFTMSMDGSRVDSASWQEGGTFTGRTLMDDGSIKVNDYDENYVHLSDIAREAGSHTQVYAAEVDDVRSALKYLGKSPDLVEMLPSVNIHADAPSREIDHDSEIWNKFISDPE